VAAVAAGSVVVGSGGDEREQPQGGQPDGDGVENVAGAAHGDEADGDGDQLRDRERLDGAGRVKARAAVMPAPRWRSGRWS